MINLDDLEPQHSASPYSLYAKLRETEPITQVSLVGLSCWLVTGYDAVREALAHPALSNDASKASPTAQKHPFVATEAMLGVGKHMLRSDPPEHDWLRRAADAAMRPELIDRLAARARAHTESLLAALAAGGSAELVVDLGLPVSTSMIMDALGVPAADRGMVGGWLMDTASTSRQDGQRMMAGYTALLSYFDTLAARLRAEPENGETDFLRAFASVDMDGSRLDSAQLVAMAYLLFAAGYRTTAYLIAGTLLSLLTHPRALAELRANPSLVPSAVEELLRFDGPVSVNMRFTTTDVQLGRTLIPGGGEPVLISLSSANRDPDRYSEPDNLDLGRNPLDHLAFGHGVHNCLGAPLARRIAADTVTVVLERYPTMTMAVDVDELDWLYSAHLRGPAALHVRFE